MAVSGRLVVLAAMGAAAVILFPGTGTILLWLGFLAVTVAVDLALAAPPLRIRLERALPQTTRLDETVSAPVIVRNDSGRLLHALLRDAWQPSAGQKNPVRRITVPAGEARAAAGTLRPEIGRAHV